MVPEFPQSTTSPGSVEPLLPCPLDHEVPGALSRHLDAERRDGSQSRQAILALEEALHLGEPVGERSEERGAVRHRLVARHGDRAGEASNGTDDGVHASFSRTSRARPSSASRVAQSPRAASSRQRPRTAS